MTPKKDEQLLLFPLPAEQPVRKSRSKRSTHEVAPPTQPRKSDNEPRHQPRDPEQG